MTALGITTLRPGADGDTLSTPDAFNPGEAEAKATDRTAHERHVTAKGQA